MTSTGPSHRPLSPGVTIAGYRLIERIGEGGMGQVWSAEGSSGEVALKLLHQAREGDGAPTSAHARLLREAQAARALDHPNVVTLCEVVELDDGTPVLVLERLEGESLAERLQRRRPMPLEEVAAWLTQVVDAVAAAHAAGIVHRDLKPSNIFLTAHDGVKVLDFGVAKMTTVEASDGALTRSGALVGTPCYMAPEQAFGERDIDDRADVWALGIVVYEALSGLLPTKAENVGQVLKIVLEQRVWPLADAAPDLPAEVTDLVDRMLSRGRDERPSLDEIAKVFAAHGGSALDLPASAVPRAQADPDPPSNADEEAARKDEPRKSPLVWVAAVALGGALTGFALHDDDPAPPPAATAAEGSAAPSTAPPVVSAQGRRVVAAAASLASSEKPVPSATSTAAPRAHLPRRPPPSVSATPPAALSAEEFDPLRQRR